MGNTKLVILKRDKEDSIFSTFEATRDHNEIGICVRSGTNNPEKNMFCSDKISCHSVRKILNPKNESQYLS
ncbi:MAG: hypothetical protein ACPKQO_03630 [Nitrososphaeraceae archaeon]